MRIAPSLLCLSLLSLAPGARADLPDLPGGPGVPGAMSIKARSLAREGGFEPVFSFSLGASAASPVGAAWASPAPFRPMAPRAPRRVAPVDRVELDGTFEVGGTPSFEELPGGIVLGLTAEPADPSADWQGARLVVVGQGLALTAADGTCYELPPAPLETLLACLAFASSWDVSDVVVDIEPLRVEVAPPFANTPLARVVEHADRTPLALLPWNPRIGKSLILDRRVTFRADPARPGRLELSADLEVRLYEPGHAWQGARSAHLVDTFPLECGPDGVARFTRAPAGAPLEGLGRGLEPVRELAGLIGFLRWVHRQDPVRLNWVRAELRALSTRGAEAAGPTR